MNNVTVLLIEELPFERKLIIDAFSEYSPDSCNILVADHLDQAPKILLNETVDVVIVDLNVSGCSKTETFEKILAQVQHIPLILLTENNNVSSYKQAIRLGAKDYLRKRSGYEKLLPAHCFTVLEKHRAQIKTNQSETFFRSTLDCLPTAIAIVNSDLSIIMANKAWYNLASQLSSLKVDDWKGLPYLSSGVGISIKKSEYSKTILRNIKMVLNRTLDGFETDYITLLESKKRWFHFRITPSAEPATDYAILEHEEITRRKNVESKLHSNREYLRLVFDTTPNLVFVKNHSGNYLMANKALMELLGIQHGTLIDVTGSALSSAEYKRLNLFESSLLQKGTDLNIAKTGSHHSEVIDKNGNKRYFKFIHQPIDFSNAEPANLTIGLDITELKESQNEIVQSENHLQTILDAMHQNIVLYNKEMRASWAKVNTIHNHPSVELGQTCTEIWHRISAGKSCALCQARKSKKIQEEIVEIDDGRFLRLTGCPVFDSSGTVTGIVCIEEDISQMHNLEKQLRQAQKMESLGTLAGGIAHDFNNILTAIMGFTEIGLIQLDKGKNLRESLLEVHKASLRARDLVHQILTFSRRVEQQLLPLDISLVIKEALKLLRSSLPSTITIESQISNQSGLVLADPTQIHQIIMNLVTNAAHSMSVTGGALRVSLKSIEFTEKMELADQQKLRPGQYTQLKISDTGAGIPPEHLSSIFEPYFTTKEHGEGTGLGLAVIHGIIKEYQGHIAVSSQLKKGTTFTILFPQFEGKEQSTYSTLQETTIKEGRGEQILVVDDEATITLLCRRILQKAGYQVSSEQDATKVLKGIQDGSIKTDLLLTDMTMPHVTGEKLAQVFRKKNNRTPIIIMSGNMSKLSSRFENDELIRLVNKPLERDSLLRNIADMLAII